MRKLTQTLYQTIMIAISIILLSSGNLALFLLSIPLLAIYSSKLGNNLMGKQIKDSLFIVTKKGKIEQSVLSNPKKMIKMLKSNNKLETFKEEALNMFLQLEKNDSHNNVTIYHTISHSITLNLLKQLEKDGYIKNLNYEKTKKSRLILERLFTFNLTNLKKHQMYKISFELTEKKINQNNQLSTENIKKQNSEKQTIQSKHNESQTRKEKLKTLLQLRENLISQSNEYNKKTK